MGFWGVDIGGTFTDLVYLGEGGELKSTKVLTTVEDLTEGILTGIRKLGIVGIEPGQLKGFLHGTTVALNALLEGKTPAVGLITTRGFRDVLEIMRTNRPNMYDLQQEKPVPLVPRFLRAEVDERLGPGGEVLRPLQLAEAAEAIDRLVAFGVKSIAVCFLHSYVNSEHEERVGELMREKYPDLHVSLSSEVIREWREFERTSTTALNAATKPIVDMYLSRLEQGLAEIGFAAEPLVMQLNGGVMSAAVARQKPVATLMSGPVGGVAGARVFLRELNAITLDIGGTSADIGIIDRGEPLLRSEGQVAGWPVLLPMIDIRSIGAGGGSIAYVDEGGALHVGPESAGASPGPACYRKGGKAPTVTDANVLLGRINPDFFLGGEMRLEVAAAAVAVGEIATKLGLDLYQAAEGIVTVLNSNMARAITEVMAEKGFDPREFSLVAFGGAGGLHAGALVQELGMARFICPPQPGTLSALGILMSDVRHDFVRVFVAPVEEVELSILEAAYEELEERGRKLLAQEGFTDLRVSCERRVELRYTGQEYTLSLNLPKPLKSLQDLIERFHREHERLYGYRMTGAPVEIVKLHASVKAGVRKPKFLWQGARLQGRLAERAYKGKRPVYISGAFIDTGIYDREKLRPGDQAAGPAVIEEFGATTLVLPGQTFSVDETLSLIVQ